MEDSEKTTDSMLLEEAMAVTEKSSEDMSAIVGDGTDETSNDLVDETMAMVQDQDGELVEGVMDNEDIEMADGAAEDSENNNLAPEDSMDAPAAILEGEDGSEEVSQGTLSTSEGFLGDDFMTQPDRMIVQSEPPQQLMEEADMPGEGIIDGEEDDGAIVAEADTTEDPAEGENELAEGDEETLLLHQDGEGVALPDGILGVISGQMGDEAGSQLHENEAEGAAEDGQAEESEEGMVLRLEEDDEGTEAADEGVTLLAAGDNLEGALSELEGKIGTAPDGTVQLLAGQEALQGMQLMEGDDKPEEEAEAARQAVQQEIQAQLQAALLKQEEMKMEQEDGPGSDTFPEDQPEQPNAANASDALATLASAALGHQAPTNGVKNEVYLIILFSLLFCSNHCRLYSKIYCSWMNLRLKLRVITQMSLSGWMLAYVKEPTAKFAPIIFLDPVKVGIKTGMVSPQVHYLIIELWQNWNSSQAKRTNSE